MVILSVSGVSLLVPGLLLHIFGLKVAGIALLVSSCLSLIITVTLDQAMLGILILMKSIIHLTGAAARAASLPYTGSNTRAPGVSRAKVRG